MENPYKPKSSKKQTRPSSFITEYVSRNKQIHYEKVRALGEGTFSQVFECIQVDTGEHYAIKQVSKSFLLKYNLRTQFTKEVKIHSRLDHPNIIKLFKVFENQNYIYLVMELGINGTLNELLQKRGKLTAVESRYYLKNIIEGLQHMHALNIVHRDLKPANLVISGKMELKIADFGLATQIRGNQRRKTFCGTPFFIAPEIIRKQEGHAYEVDYWSCGIILYNMLYGEYPFLSDNAKSVYRLIETAQVQYDETVDQDANDLVEVLLSKDWKQRADYDVVLNSKFMNCYKYIPEKLPQKTLHNDPTKSFISKYDTTYQLNTKNKDLQKNIYEKIPSALSQFSEIKDEAFEYSYVKKWVNYSDKFGIGYILNNGIIGIFFNDKSKMILSNFGITFHYISSENQKNYESYNILNYPSELKKKVKILEHFIQQLKTKKQLFKIQEDMPDNFDFIMNYKVTRYAVLLLLSNKLYQIIFKDGVEIHILTTDNGKIIVYIDKQRNKTKFQGKIENQDALKRLTYIQGELATLKNNNQFSFQRLQF